MPMLTVTSSKCLALVCKSTKLTYINRNDNTGERTIDVNGTIQCLAVGIVFERFSPSLIEPRMQDNGKSAANAVSCKVSLSASLLQQVASCWKQEVARYIAHVACSQLIAISQHQDSSRGRRREEDALTGNGAKSSERVNNFRCAIALLLAAVAATDSWGVDDFSLPASDAAPRSFPLEMRRRRGRAPFSRK